MLRTGEPPDKNEKPRILNAYVEVYKEAMTTRRFEVDLYWKRATYYWTFNGAAFVGLNYVNRQTESPCPLSMIFACLGTIFSVAWILSSLGSKYWQSYWEKRVKELEKEIPNEAMRIFSKTYYDDNYWVNSRYSVTRINVILGIFVLIVWLFILLRETILNCPQALLLNLDPRTPIEMQWLPAVIALIGCFTLVTMGRSTADRD